MPEVIVTTREGEQKKIAYIPGISLMQAICEGGVDEMLALCGGVCSCATCHVHVDPACTGLLNAKSEDEDDLLSGSEHKNELSRLSCQIRMTDELSGLQVTVAPED